MALGAGREAPGAGEHNGAGQGVFAPNVSKWARPRGLWTRLFRGTRREEEISVIQNLKVRREALERAQRRCEKCGCQTNLKVHHVVPPSAGGPETVENAVVLCVYCHREMCHLKAGGFDFRGWMSLPPAPVVAKMVLEAPDDVPVETIRSLLRTLAEEARHDPAFWWGKSEGLL